MPSREALRLAEQTGCLPTEAAAALEAEPEPNYALAALNSVMSFRRQLYSSRLTEVWTSLTGSPTADEMDVDQTIEFVQRLGLQLEDPLVLTVAYELQAPNVGSFKRQGFIDGWARLEAGNLDDMVKVVIPQLAERFQNDSSYFKEVYRFTFRFSLSDGERLMPCDSALAYWQLLLAPRYPELTKKLIEFAEKNQQKISADTWFMLIQFFEYATNEDPKLEKYDETSAWPAAIDDFVEFLSS